MLPRRPGPSGVASAGSNAVRSQVDDASRPWSRACSCWLESSRGRAHRGCGRPDRACRRCIGDGMTMRLGLSGCSTYGPKPDSAEQRPRRLVPAPRRSTSTSTNVSSDDFIASDTPSSATSKPLRSSIPVLQSWNTELLREALFSGPTEAPLPTLLARLRHALLPALRKVRGHVKETPRQLQMIGGGQLGGLVFWPRRCSHGPPGRCSLERPRLLD